MLPVPEFTRNIVRGVTALPGRIVPYAVQRPVLHAVLNRAFRVPLEDGELEFLEGTLVRIRITDISVDWLIEVAADEMMPVDRAKKADLCISGELFDFTLLATRQVDHDQLFFQRRIHLEGDTELGLGLKNTMDGMDWEDLPPPLRLFLQGLGAVIARLPAGFAQGQRVV